MHDSGAGQIRHLYLDLFQAALVGLICLLTQLGDDRVPKRASGVRIGLHAQTWPVEVLNCKPGHIGVVLFAGYRPK
jgi:hypothetical protein